MASRLLFFPAAALFAAAAFAHAPDEDSLPEKSVDQIRCELAGDCLELDLSPTADAFDPPPPDIAPPAALRSAAPQSSLTRSARNPAATEPPSRMAAASHEPGTSALTINFIADSAAFTEAGRMQADRVFQAIHAAKFADKRFLIAGHTNATGESAANLRLSRKRADALAEYLVAAGIDRGRLDVVGYGASHPLPGVPPRNSANRRVEISIID